MRLIQRIVKAGAVASMALLGTNALAADRPNVLFIAVDDLKTALGAFGDKFARTPNIDALSNRGTVFLNAHCQQAVCAPSRASLMLGRRPDRTGIFDLQTEFRPLSPDAVTLAQAFKNNGYRSIGMGKIYDPRSAGGARKMDPASWSEPYPETHCAADETFGYRNPEVVEAVQEKRKSVANEPKNWDNAIKLFFPNGKPATDRAAVPDNAYEDGALAEQAVERLGQLAKNRNEPFFLAVGFHKPHLPFNAPEKYWSMYDPMHIELAKLTDGPAGAPSYATQPGWELRNYGGIPKDGPLPEATQRNLIHGYYAATSYMDAQLGNLIAALDANGLRDNTIIVLWGDHGWHLGDHGIWCKHTNYEQATRSPLLIVAPGVGKPGRSAAPVEFVDIYPTLLDLAGLSAAGTLDGVSLRPILADATASVKPLAISQYPRGNGENEIVGYTYRDARYRLVQWRRMTSGGDITPVIATELYDYEKDAAETKNLADDPAYAEILKEMEAKALTSNYPDPSAKPIAPAVAAAKEQAAASRSSAASDRANRRQQQRQQEASPAGAAE